MQISPDSMLYYLVVLLIFGNAFALAIGVLMLVAPQQLTALSKLSNRWISMRKITRPLEIPRATDGIALRYPRVLGAILLASAALILIKGGIFITGMSTADGGNLLARFFSDVNISPDARESLWISLVAFIVLGAVMAVVVGLMSLFNPGKLLRKDQSINHWVSTRQLSKPLDTPHYHLDKLVQAQPRVWGGVITALALFSAVVLWVVVLGV